MKTKTLVIAALIVGVLMAISLVPPGGMQGAIPQAVAEDGLEAVVDTDMDATVDEEYSDESAFEDLVAAEVVEEDLAMEDETETIEIDTERKLSEGIDVTMNDEGEDLISITLDDVPLQDVVRMFTRISGANIVAGTNLHGSVTVSLTDVEWEPAFRVILDSVDQVLVEKTEGIYTIMGKDALASEPVTVDTVFLNFTTVSNVMPVVQRMLVTTNSSVSAFPSANALVIQETVERINTIKNVIDKIDIPRPQVYIEAKFVELRDQAITDIGIDWSVLGSDEDGVGYTLGASRLQRDFESRQNYNELDSSVDIDLNTLLNTRSAGTAGDTRLDSSADQKITAGIDGKNLNSSPSIEDDKIDFDVLIPYMRSEVLTSVLSADDFALTLSALNQNDGVDIISNPKVIVANEERAVIHVGQNEPNVVAVPQGDSGDRFAYTLDAARPFFEVGVKLEVVPTVNTEDNITVKLIPELSRLLAPKVVGAGSTGQISFPRMNIRRVDTEFSLESGNTVAIGGLSEANDQEIVKKVPVLGDIPLLGKYLFTHTHTDRVKDEVIIFVTVGLAEPENLVEVAGVPSEATLVHEHLAHRAAQDDGQ
jgi:type IV pilus assembly protein PilQ